MVERKKERRGTGSGERSEKGKEKLKGAERGGGKRRNEKQPRLVLN